MTPEEIDKLFPEFEKWMKKRYLGVLVHPSVLKCWYEFLCLRRLAEGDRKAENTHPPKSDETAGVRATIRPQQDLNIISKQEKK